MLVSIINKSLESVPLDFGPLDISPFLKTRWVHRQNRDNGNLHECGATAAVYSKKR